VVRLPTAGQDGFLADARDVWAGLTSAAWITVDDTGARHKETNGFCTQIGNAHFARFGTTGSKNSARNLNNGDQSAYGGGSASGNAEPSTRSFPKSDRVRGSAGAAGFGADSAARSERVRRRDGAAGFGSDSAARSDSVRGTAVAGCSVLSPGSNTRTSMPTCLASAGVIHLMSSGGADAAIVSI
jgi:hypothetical protein